MPIRSAKISDIPEILNLLEQILKVHHQARPDLFTEKGAKFTVEDLKNLLKDPEKPIFVYLDDQEHIVGHLFLELRQPKHPVRKPVKSLFIEDLCVSESARSQGIGRELYIFAKNYAKENDCYNLTLNVWNDNLGALNFYLNLGMTPQQTQLEELL